MPVDPKFLIVFMALQDRRGHPARSGGRTIGRAWRYSAWPRVESRRLGPTVLPRLLSSCYLAAATLPEQTEPAAHFLDHTARKPKVRLEAMAVRKPAENGQRCCQISPPCWHSRRYSTHRAAGRRAATIDNSSNKVAVKAPGKHVQAGAPMADHSSN